MPVQLPELKRFDPVAPASAGEIKANIPDISNVGVAAQNTLAAAGTSIAETQFKAEDDARNVIGMKAANDYEVQKRGGLEQAKQVKGDPTEAYTKLDQDSQTWKDNLLAQDQYANVDSRTKQVIQAHLNRVDFELNSKAAVDRAIQYNNFEMNTTNDSIKLNKEKIMDATATVDAKNPDSFLPIQDQIDRIKDTRIASLSRQGLAVVDPTTGEVKSISPTGQMQIKKDISDGLKDSINTLNSVGNTDAAKFLLDKYSDDILADTKVKLMTDHSSSIVKNQGLDLANKYKNLDPVAQLHAIDNAPDASLEVKQKAKEFADTNQRQLSAAKARASSDTYERLAKYVDDKSKQGQGFVSSDQLQNDVVYNRLKGNLDEKHVVALKQMIDTPKTSDPVAAGGAYDLAFNGKLQGMSFSDLQQNLVHVGQKDRNSITSMWKNANDPAKAETQQAVNFMGSRLTSEMQGAGLIKLNQYGKYGNADQIKRTQYYDDMLQQAQQFPPGTSVTERNKWVKEYIQARISGEAFHGSSQSTKPAPFQGAVSGTTALSATPAPSAPPATKPSPSQMNDMLSLWKKTTGRSFDPKQGDTAAKMQQLWNSQGKK